MTKVMSHLSHAHSHIFVHVQFNPCLPTYTPYMCISAGLESVKSRSGHSGTQCIARSSPLRFLATHHHVSFPFACFQELKTEFYHSSQPKMVRIGVGADGVYKVDSSSDKVWVYGNGPWCVWDGTRTELSGHV